MDTKRCLNCSTIYKEEKDHCPFCGRADFEVSQKKQTIFLPKTHTFRLLNIWTISSCIVFLWISESTLKQGFWSAWIIGILNGLFGLLIGLGRYGQELPRFGKIKKELIRLESTYRKHNISADQFRAIKPNPFVGIFSILAIISSLAGVKLSEYSIAYSWSLYLAYGILTLIALIFYVSKNDKYIKCIEMFSKHYNGLKDIESKIKEKRHKEQATQKNNSKEAEDSGAIIKSILVLACVIIGMIGIIRACGALNDQDGICDAAGCKSIATTSFGDMEFCIKHYIDWSNKAYND